MKNRVSSILLAGTLCLVPVTALAQDEAGTTRDGTAGEEPRTTVQGVFSEAQVERGQEVMWMLCAECHVDEDFQGPFLSSWQGATVKALYDEIVATMPEDSPSSLEPAEYVDVIAYVFKLNGLPTGEDEMSTDGDALDRITIEIPDP